MLTLRPYQRESVAAVYDHLRHRDDNPCVVLPTGCHAAGHPILMFDGTVKPVEDIRVGDKLMGPDSQPRLVIRLCRGEDEMFRVVPNRGEAFIVNGDHVLSLMSTNEGKRWDCTQKGGEITNISVRDYLTKTRSWKHLRKLYRVPIDFQSSACLPLPAYILGLLIGDGHIVDTVELTTVDEQTADAWDEYVQSIGSRNIVRDHDNRCPTYRMITGRGKYNIVTEVLENLGLAGCRSFSKFIPHIYLTANRNDRLQLLAGLIDSDGSRHRSGFEITTASRELAADIVFLCRSLGYSANCASKYSCCQTGADGWYFRIYIDGNCHEVPCRLPRKQAGRRAQKKDPLRTGFKIEACGRGQYFGFELSGDHLYVDGHFVVHHNSGKTPVMATICRDAVLTWSGRVLIVAHVKELLEQSAEKLRVVCPEVKFGIYSAGLKRRDTEAPVIVAGIQSIYKRACELGPFDLILVDECFPAGTLIATPKGTVPIEMIRAGDTVLNGIGTGEVLATSARPASDLVTLEFSDGTTITCTAGHPVFTDRGWIPAAAMELGAMTFGVEEMRALWDGVSPVEQETVRRSYSSDEGASLETATLLLDLLLEEAQQPNVAGDEPQKGQPQAPPDRASTPHTRGKRTPHAGGSEGFVGDPGTVVDSGVRRPDTNAEIRRLADPLQDRHRELRTADCHRNRRPLPRFPGQEETGSSQDDVTGGKRLVSSTHHLCESPSTVYNLHVGGHPSYFANGILVHNCHLIPEEGEGMYQRFLTEARVVNPHVRVIGLTATPYRLKSGMICTPDHFLNEVCYEVGVRELIVQGYLSPLVTKAGITGVDTSAVHVRGGEFVTSEVEDLMDQDELVEAACQEIIACTQDRHAVLIFTTGIKHGSHVQSMLQRQHGVECGFVSGETPTAERDATLKNFRDGKLRYLSNVNVLTTGFDAPNIDCVVMLRPTMSAGLYYQMVGRGFRLHPGKQNCLVLDFGGNVLRHGPVDAIRVEERTNGDGAAPAKECPICRAVIAAGYGTCPQCGYEFPPPERQPHEAQATEAGILSDQASDTTFEVRDISWSVHQKRDAPEDAPKSMRVDYRLGLSHWQSEWICFEHTGFARQKAEAWWQQRSNDPVPETAEQAVTLAEAGALCQTNTITVRSIPGERFDRIVGHDLDAKPEPVPSFNHVDLDDLPF